MLLVVGDIPVDSEAPVATSVVGDIPIDNEAPVVTS